MSVVQKSFIFLWSPEFLFTLFNHVIGYKIEIKVKRQIILSQALMGLDSDHKK